jgi:hypothetical protein
MKLPEYAHFNSPLMLASYSCCQMISWQQLGSRAESLQEVQMFFSALSSSFLKDLVKE